MTAFRVVREALGLGDLCQCPSGQTKQKHSAIIPRGEQHIGSKFSLRCHSLKFSNLGGNWSCQGGGDGWIDLPRIFSVPESLPLCNLEEGFAISGQWQGSRGNSFFPHWSLAGLTLKQCWRVQGGWVPGRLSESSAPTPLCAPTTLELPRLLL